MDQRGHAIDHREYEELLAAAALGALTPEEHAALKHHMRTCAACRQEYGWLLSVADALPLAIEEREPPAELREWLRVEVEQDARARQWQPHGAAPNAAQAPLPQAAPRPRGRIVGWPVWVAAAAAVLLIGLLAGVVIDRLWLDDDAAPSEREIALQFPTGMQLDDASLTWMPDDGVLRFSAPDMPATQAGQVYQVWLIAGQDQPPTPVGTIDQQSGAFATTVDPDRHGTFAVTVEPGPLGSVQPTSEPVIVGQLEDAASA